MKDFKYREVFVVLDGPADPSSPDSIHASVYADRDNAISCMDVIMSFSDLRDVSLSMWRLRVNELCTEQDVQEVVRDLVARGKDGPFLRYGQQEDSHAFLSTVEAVSA